MTRHRGKREAHRNELRRIIAAAPVIVDDDPAEQRRLSREIGTAMRRRRGKSKHRSRR